MAVWMDGWMDGCLCRQLFSHRHSSSYGFCRILAKLGTHIYVPVMYAQNCGTGLQNFDFKICGKFLKF